MRRSCHSGAPCLTSSPGGAHDEAPSWRGSQCCVTWKDSLSLTSLWLVKLSSATSVAPRKVHRFPHQQFAVVQVPIGDAPLASSTHMNLA